MWLEPTEIHSETLRERAAKKRFPVHATNTGINMHFLETILPVLLLKLRRSRLQTWKAAICRLWSGPDTCLCAQAYVCLQSSASSPMPASECGAGAVNNDGSTRQLRQLGCMNGNTHSCRQSLLAVVQLKNTVKMFVVQADNATRHWAHISILCVDSINGGLMPSFRDWLLDALHTIRVLPPFLFSSGSPET
jgi:hypothetical protein